MKKLITFIAVSLLSTCLFAELKWFKPRFFEFYINGPFSVSNNAFYLDDIMQENAVIDLTKIANELPKSGFSTYVMADPSFGFNVNIKNSGFGVDVSVQNYEKFNIAKGLFDFLGKGNELNEELDFAMRMNADMYLDLGLNIRFPVKEKYKIKIIPTVFAPLVHITTQDSKVLVQNTEDGKFIVDLQADAKVYSFLATTDIKDNFEFPTQGYGFDLGGEVEFPINNTIYFKGFFRTPVIPGHLKYVSNATVTYNLEKKLMDFIGGGLDMNLKPDINYGAFEEANYAVNRPLKLDVYLDITPMDDFFHLINALGFGVRNPFTGNHEAVFYPEYKLGAMFKLDNIMTLTVATEYTEELFKHSFAYMINLRLVEVDAEVGFAAPNITSSFRGAGASAAVAFKFGF